MSNASIAYVSDISEISNSLEKTIASNSIRCVNNSTESVFDAKMSKKISIKDYLLRIIKYTEIELSTLKYAIMILQKYCLKASVMLLEKNIFKLIFICIIVSLKVNEDCIFSDKDFSLIGGFSLKTLALLELELLETLDYKVAFLELYLN